MHAGRMVVLAGLALMCVGARARAEEYAGPAAYRTAVFWNPADRFWSGSLAPGGCNGAGRAGPLAAGVRAAFQRQAELIGEIRALPAQAPLVLAQAHACAAEADSTVTTAALLTEAERNWGLFQKAFSICMTRSNQAQYVGSMTLWIDQRCDW